MVVFVSRGTAVDLLWDGSASSYSGESPLHKRRSSVCFIASPGGTVDDVSNVSGNNTNVDAISGCWDQMAEPWNNIDGRCACVGHRGMPSRRRECDVVLETGVTASACLWNATRHTGAIQGTLRQPVVKSRSARHPRMSSAEKPITVGVEPRVVKGFRECCSVAHPGDNVDVLAHDQRVQLLTTEPSFLARTVHATQLHLEATFAEATAQPCGVGTSQLPQDSLRFLVPLSHNSAVVEEAKSLLYTLGTSEHGNNQLVRVACLGPYLFGPTFFSKDCEIWARSSGIYYHPSKLVDSSIKGEIREAILVLDTLAYHASFVLVICNANEYGPFTSVHMAEKHKGFLTDFDKETIYSSVRSMVESSEFFRLFRKKLTVSSLREEQILGCFMIALKVSLAHSNGTLDAMLTYIKRDCEQNVFRPHKAPRPL